MVASQGHSRANAGLFIGILLAGAAVIALALIGGGAPISAGIYLNDWIDWARISPSMSGLLALGAIMVLIGIVGTLVSLMAPKPQSPKLGAQKPASPVARKVAEANAAPQSLPLVSAVGATTVGAAKAAEAPPLPQLVADNTRKASLRFEAPAPGEIIPAPTPAPEADLADAPGVSAEIIPFRNEAARTEPQEETVSTGSAVASDAAEDTAADPIAAALLQDGPEARTAPEATADINAVIHSAMQFIATPDPAGVTSVAEVHAARAEETHSDAPAPTVAGPATVPMISMEEPVKSTAEYKALSEALALGGSDSLLGSALLDSVVLEPAAAASEAAPLTLAEAEAAAETGGVEDPIPAAVPSPAAEIVPETTPEVTADSEIDSAVAAALPHWPDATRDIAESELRVRLGQLYHDNALQSREAFALARKGDLAAAAAALETQAREFTESGTPSRAAQLWRIFGALHMGRDDTAAMRAYEQVSGLDTADANIHLYLVHRYRMAGDEARLLPVLGRALGAVKDRDTRLDLLTQFADLSQKGGHLAHTARALEELSDIRAAEAAEDPDNLQKRSAQAIALARQAQVRELLGEATKAAPLYQHAHRVFAELSARVPDHAGLKAMAENARRDAERLSA